MAQRVAVLGLGTMGSGMAATLLKAGYDVTVYNRTPAKAESLRASGAHVAATPAQAVANAEFIVSMLADDAASREVWMGENGAIGATQPGAVAIESSTVTPARVVAPAKAAAQNGRESPE